MLLHKTVCFTFREGKSVREDKSVERVKDVASRDSHMGPPNSTPYVFPIKV